MLPGAKSVEYEHCCPCIVLVLAKKLSLKDIDIGLIYIFSNWYLCLEIPILLYKEYIRKN